MEIKHYQRMRNIDRLSGTLKNRQYDLMQHSYMVAILFMRFSKLEGIPIDMVVLDCVLHHDILEVITGDLIWPVKNFSAKTKASWELIEEEIVNSNPEFKKYSDVEMENTMTKIQYTLFKACDVLDLYIFCMEEQTMGNHSKEVIEVIYNCRVMLDGKFSTIDNYILNYGK
jgi:5'-deoxynucleotidase YfbR-like HD superfamily hydrolase